MKQIVECVPNFSEGRRSEVIDAIVEAMLAAPDVYLLGREMDSDHNRAVVTIAGAPESIAEAAFRGVAAAARLIDLTRHRGEHPRIGAADVVPFVPISGVTLDDCVRIARTVGERIAAELSIPVFLYEAAATRPERANLENVRKGQFEGLREEIAVNPDRRPDFGAPRVHSTAGAVAVGARKPLIAYNINLNTPDVNIAKQIARRVRFSSGGFRYVKAMGVFLRDKNQAQVSMNLTDYEQTPVELVFETVRRLAKRFGVSVAGSEIVGLIPQRALDQAAEFFLQIENFRPSMVLETRLSEVMVSAAAPGRATLLTDSLRGFIERLASRDPVPGGGSAAALAGALGAALGQMAVRVTRGKKGYEQHAARHDDALDRLAPYASTLLELIDADAEAFRQVLAARRLPKHAAGRDDQVQRALVRATEIPSRTAGCAAESLRILEDIRTIVHPNVASDLQVGLQMARAALRGAIANMRANLTGVTDPETRLRYEDMIAGWEQALKGPP